MPDFGSNNGCRKRFVNGSPGRLCIQGVFRYNGGQFVSLGAGRWVEERNSGPNSNFTQVTRNATYVELLDKDRNVRVRLYQDQGMSQDKLGRWFTWPGSQGTWVK